MDSWYISIPNFGFSFIANYQKIRKEIFYCLINNINMNYQKK